jgi:hypothetical protein
MTMMRSLTLRLLVLVFGGLPVYVARSRRAWSVLLSVALPAAMASFASAVTIVASTSAPTVGLAGFTTFTLTATSAPGTKLIGFDFAGDGSTGPGAKGFFGSMNQVNPAGFATVFNDNNAFFAFVPGSNVSQDSQFRVKSTDGVSVKDAEGPTFLQSAFSYNPPGVATATNVWQFAQLAIPDAASGTFSFNGTFTVQNAQGNNSLDIVSGGTFPGLTLPPVVNPLDFTSIFLNATVSGTVTATNNPTSWGPAGPSIPLASYTPNYGAVGGVGFVANAGWDPATQQFSWNTTGAKRGEYVWNVSATNAGGTGNGTVTVFIYGPEPASIVLAGLAMIGMIGFARRYK